MENNVEKPTKDQIIANMKRCPQFYRCSRNFCLLDLKLHLRSGNVEDKCRFMQEPRTKKIKGRIVVFGGRVMPNACLNFVPQRNVHLLNEASRHQLNKLKNNNQKYERK